MFTRSPARLAVAALSGLLTVSALAPAARAQVTIQFDQRAESFAQQVGVDSNALRNQIQTELERLFQVYRVRDYLRAFGDAQAFTTRGLGVDYGSNVRYVEAGVGASVAVNGDRAALQGDTRTAPPAGVGTNLTVMAGFNLGVFGPVPLTLFANYFKSHGTINEFDARLENIGVHLQLKLFGERDESVWTALLRWGGVDVTTGFDRARMQLELSREFTRDIPISDGQRDVASARVESTGNFTLDMRTWSIPIEVTTNMRFLYVLSAYIGGGFDWQLGGGSDMNLALSGNLTGAVPQATDRTPLGAVRITARESVSPSAGRLRGIVGLQANVFILKLFVQLNATPAPPLAAVAFGGRLVW